MKSPSTARPPAAPPETSIPTPPAAPSETAPSSDAEATATVAAPAAAPASSSPSASAQVLAPGKVIKLTVTAASPLWRCPPEWVKHWPTGETIVEAAEFAEHTPETIEAMIALLDGDPNFTVAVERAAEPS